MVYRIYVEKKLKYAVEAQHLLADIHQTFGFNNISGLRIINRYDVEGISDENFKKAQNIIFSEPPVDNIYFDIPAFNENQKVYAIEYLPGQFDIRADSTAQCFNILTESERPAVKTAKLYFIDGINSAEQLQKIKNYIINPVEAQEASLELPKTLKQSFDIPTKIETVTNFINFDENELKSFLKYYSLAMDFDDIKFMQKYFKDDENRDPTITEIRMIDTYWSDHCRHTTFLTEITNANIHVDYVQNTYNKYKNIKKELGNKKPETLMDIATIGAKYLKKQNKLNDLDISEEINACSVNVKAKINNFEQDYLLMFKNETHNHPTEIEPFGGAATCLGGAIRDPLSGRSYVYQAMRVTGSADPRTSFEETLKGKLPQKKITTTAAAGYSSYGNQIGLATGLVNEIYHPGYVAKRLEIGAVVGAAPLKNVIREEPVPGDVVILLGGATGRDGLGGATGSSKSHTIESIETCGAEVQKGNPAEERKIQRLFRNGEVTKLIKRCNDFGAGGVSVAVGELADGLEINIDAVPKKYEGLDGTELAISESQERMAIVVDKKNVNKFIKMANDENLNAAVVAVVTEEKRLKMKWNGNYIVDINRNFLNSNGANKYTTVKVEKDPKIKKETITEYSFKEKLTDTIKNLNVCSQKGLIERFDSTIGASSVFLPFGGKYQLTPSQTMAAILPSDGDCSTASVMSFGFDPYLSSENPFKGAVYAVIESVAKLIASGVERSKIWLTFQEYFERTMGNPVRWGKPFNALLGALDAQLGLEIAAIGGKDSMSGTFEDIDVPPTLVSFAVGVSDAEKLISSEFKEAGRYVYYAEIKTDENGLPDYTHLNGLFDKINQMISDKKITSCRTITSGGVAECIFKMCLGNKIGFEFDKNVVKNTLFDVKYGSFVFESGYFLNDFMLLGKTIDKDFIIFDETINLNELIEVWQKPLENIFPTQITAEIEKAQEFNYNSRDYILPKIKNKNPKALITVFPGTNCEYDSAKMFAKAGADNEIFVIRNRTAQDLKESIDELAKAIRNTQIIMFPGGFSSGDEPDGSGKFIATFYRNPKIIEAVDYHLQHDGLILGICNGFQVLIKLGLLPNGNISDITENSPTLTFNKIGRHQTTIVRTRISSVKSPWMMYNRVGEVHKVAISHGEGRFIANPEVISQLMKNGQIATQYIDMDDNVSMDIKYNPNTSNHAIEGIFSVDGKIFGKMGHSERIGNNVAKNVYGLDDQKIFKAGVDYFK